MTNIQVSEKLTAAALSILDDPRWVDRAFARLGTTDKACSYFTFTSSARSGYNVKSAVADLLPLWAYHKDITPQVRDNAYPDIDLEEVSAKFAAHKLAISRQAAWVRDFIRPGVWRNESRIADLIRDPKGTIKDAAAGMRNATGLAPNVLVLGYDVYRNIKGIGDDLAALLCLEEILPCVTVTNDGSGTLSYLMVGQALLLYRPPEPSFWAPAAGYRLTRTDLTTYNNLGVRAYPVSITDITRVEVELSSTPVLVAPDLGHLFY